MKSEQDLTPVAKHLFPWLQLAADEISPADQESLKLRLSQCADTSPWAHLADWKPHIDASFFILRGQYAKAKECLLVQDPLRSELHKTCLMSLLGLVEFRITSAKSGLGIWRGLLSGTQTVLHQLYNLHRAADLAQYGQCQAALHALEEWVNPSLLMDAHSQSIYFNLMASAHTSLGNYSAASTWVQRDAQVSRLIGNEFWKAAVKRREINVLVEQEHFAEALVKIDTWLSGEDVAPVTAVLLLKLRFQCLTGLAPLAEVEKSFQQIESKMKENGLSESTISLSEEKAECLLLGIPLQAQNNFKDLLLRAIERDDLAGECVLRLAQGRWELSGRNTESALHQFESSLSIAERQGYKKQIALLKLQIASVQIQVGRVLDGVSCLAQCQDLAEECGLRSTLECARVLLRLLEPQRNVQLNSFLPLVLQPSARLRSFLEIFFGIQNSETSFSLTWKISSSRGNRESGRTKEQNPINRTHRADFLKGVETLRKFAGDIFWIPGHFVGRKLRGEWTWMKSDPLLELFLEKETLSYDQIVSERVGRETEFHSLKHGGALRMQLSRFRKHLSGIGLGIEVQSNTQIARLVETSGNTSSQGARVQNSSPRIHSIQLLSSNRKSGAAKTAKPRKSDDVLNFIESQERASLAELRFHFKISRQALLRQLTLLKEKGKVSHEKLGRESFYLRPRS